MVSQKKKNFECSIGCPVEAFLYLFSGKWRGVITYHIAFNNKVGFNFLLENIEGISRRTLSLQLKFLQKKGIINKEVVTYKPLRINYFLTEYGQKIYPILLEMETWFITNKKEFNSYLSNNSDSQ